MRTFTQLSSSIWLKIARKVAVLVHMRNGIDVIKAIGDGLLLLQPRWKLFFLSNPVSVMVQGLRQWMNLGYAIASLTWQVC